MRSVLCSMVPSAKDDDEMDASGGNDGCEDTGNKSRAVVGDRHGTEHRPIAKPFVL